MHLSGPAPCRPPFANRTSSLRSVAELTLTFVLLLLVVSTMIGCAGEPSPSLVAGVQPRRSEGFTAPSRLTDGIRAPEGEPWDSDVSCTFLRTQAFVEYDLGASKPIRAAYIQGDNNDEYILSGSNDGTRFEVIWIAPAQQEPGLRARATDRLDAKARYLRVTAQGGDRRFALSEVQVFSDPPSRWTNSLRERSGLPSAETIRSRVMLLVLACAAWLWTTRRRSSIPWLLVTLLLPLWAGAALAQGLVDAWPVEGREVAFVRAGAAALVAVALLREFAAPKAYKAHPGPVFATLSAGAIAAFMAFFNLGHPQFMDRKAGEPLFVHNFDMRVYYPVAKYFDELRYDGLYQASVAAYVDDVRAVSLESLGNVELRDLKNHRLTRVADPGVKEEIRAIKGRFSPERWETFKVDMRYFRETMGIGDYLGTMRDHGANATPVWLAIAHLVFSQTAASNTTLTLAGLIDPLLLLLALAGIGRAFGLRTMLVSMAVFGANDFYMFGSNWAGATLRHDWMAYLALGICALKTERWAIGGALLALSAAIRAFPALALMALAIPVGYWLFDFVREHRRRPALSELVNAQRPALTAAAGAGVCVLVVWLGSSLLFSFDAWSEWLSKVRLLDRDPHVNHISLRALVAGSDHLQLRLLNQRAAVFVAGILLSVAAIVLAARRKPLDQVAVLGTLLIPVVFNPANYYIHFIFVLPLLAIEHQRVASASGRAARSGHDGWIWGILLILCIAQYWETLVRDLDLHFQMATALLFASIAALLSVVLLRDRPVWWASSARAAEPSPLDGRPLSGGEPLSDGDRERGAESPETEDRDQESQARVEADAPSTS